MYPSAPSSIEEPIDIPASWRRFISFDYGLSDDAVFIFAAVDEKNHLLHIYKEVRTNNKSVEELAKLYHENIKDIPSGGLVTTPIIDPKSGFKRDPNLKTLADLFLDYGIAFKPGAVSVDARVYRLNTYFESGKIKIFNTCTDLIRELREYKFKPDETQHSGFTGKPEDKNNHGINALEWIAMELPADPANLMYGIYDRMGRDLTKEQRMENPAFWALSDDAYETVTPHSHENPYGHIDYDYAFF